jgi:exonuclease V gamma subunit
LPLPPRAGWAYAERWRRDGDVGAALEAAAAVWRGDDRRRGERDDADQRIAFRGVDPLDTAEFRHWAERIGAPLAAALAAERRR